MTRENTWKLEHVHVKSERLKDHVLLLSILRVYIAMATQNTEEIHLVS